VAAAQPLAVAAVPATYAPSGSWSGAVTANALEDVEPSTAETLASHVDLSVPTDGEVAELAVAVRRTASALGRRLGGLDRQ
jgi:hypothetical protein